MARPERAGNPALRAPLVRQVKVERLGRPGLLVHRDLRERAGQRALGEHQGAADRPASVELREVVAYPGQTAHQGLLDRVGLPELRERVVPAESLAHPVAVVLRDRPGVPVPVETLVPVDRRVQVSFGRVLGHKGIDDGAL
jgi:hypothetical protein